MTAFTLSPIFPSPSLQRTTCLTPWFTSSMLFDFLRMFLVILHLCFCQASAQTRNGGNKARPRDSGNAAALFRGNIEAIESFNGNKFLKCDICLNAPAEQRAGIQACLPGLLPQSARGPCTRPGRGKTRCGSRQGHRRQRGQRELVLALHWKLLVLEPRFGK